MLFLKSSLAPITLSLVEGADLAQIEALHRICFPDDPWDRKILKLLCENPSTEGLKAVLPGGPGASLAPAAQEIPAGFILWRWLGDEGEILTFCVAPSLRLRGIGKDLLGRLFELAAQRAVNRIVLEVAADNAAAFALYRSLGFQKVATRKAYYRRSNGCSDAWVMALDLEHPCK